MRSKLNHFLYRFKYNYGLYLPLKKPVDVSLELSSFCDMRCGYCLDPETPVLRRDLSWDKIKNLKEGDELVSFDEYAPGGNKTRRMRVATVEKAWKTVKPAKRITTSTGSFVASDDHLFLMGDARWKKVGNFKVGNEIVFSRKPWTSPDILNVDYIRGYLLGITEGDATARWQPLPGNTGKTDDSRRQIWWRIALVDTEPLTRVLEYFNRIGIENNGLKTFNKSKDEYKDLQKIEIRKSSALNKLKTFIYDTDSIEDQYLYEAGYVAGMFDCEGSYGVSHVLRISQKQENDVFRKCSQFLDRLGLEYKKECTGLRLCGGTWDTIFLLGSVSPAIKRKTEGWVDKGVYHKKIAIEKIEEIGPRPLIDIQTSTKTFYANGYATHNCYHADQNNLPFKRAHMRMGTAFRIIELAAAAKVNSLKFNWKGESTLNANYHLITKFARGFRKGSTFIEMLANSNFNFEPSDAIYDGLSNLTKVKISYDSFIKPVFESQRVRGDHDRVTKNIDNFYNYKKRWENGTVIVIQAVRTDNNANEDLESKIKERWPDAEVSVRDMVQGRNEATTKGYKTINFLERKPCLQAFVRLIFNAQGDAMMCCPDTKEIINLGNIHEVDSIEEIFNSPSAQAVRATLKDGSAFKADPCKTCSSYESYKGYKGKWGS